MSTTVYSKGEWSLFGAYFRCKCVYDVTSTNTTTTFSGTIYLQHKGSAYSSSDHTTGSIYAILSTDGVSAYCYTAATSSVSAHSGWTDIKSKAFSVSTARSTTNLSGYFAISSNNKSTSSSNPDVNTYFYTIPVLASYTVSYNANGGSGAPASQTKYYGKTLQLQKTKPTRTYYEFTSWNTNSSGTGTNYAPSSNYTENSAVTLYANWTQVAPIVTLGTPNAIRVDTSSSTTESDEGEYAYITVPYTVTGPPAADVTLTVTATADSGTAPTVTRVNYTDSKAANTTASGTFTAVASGCSTETRYEFTVTVSAQNTSTTGQSPTVQTRTIVLPTAYFTFDIYAGGHGLGIGKPAKRDALDIGMDTHIDSKTLMMESTNLDRDGSNPSSQTVGNSALWFVDEDGERVGRIYAVTETDGRQRISMAAYNDNSGTEVANILGLYAAKDGTLSYSVGNAAAFRSAINCVNKSGDNMTGALTGQGSYFYAKCTNLDRDGSDVIDEAIYGNSRFYFRDKDNEWLGGMRVAKMTDGRMALNVMVGNENTSGTEVSNVISLFVARNGTKTYSVSDAAAFRSAIGLGSMGTLKTSDVSSGLSVSSSAYVSIASVSLEAGKWVITYGAVFPHKDAGGTATTSGTRSAWIYTTANSAGSGAYYRASRTNDAPIGTDLYLHGSHSITTSSTITMYLTLYQTSGATLNCTGYLRAIQIM